MKKFLLFPSFSSPASLLWLFLVVAVVVLVVIFCNAVSDVDVAVFFAVVSGSDVADVVVTVIAAAFLIRRRIYFASVCLSDCLIF